VSEQPTLWGRVTGNREVSRLFLLAERGDRSGALGEATPKEESSWGKHFFPHGSESKASDERGVFA
jgi:hypothetical protein